MLEQPQLERLIQVLKDAAELCRKSAQGAAILSHAYKDDEEVSREILKEAVIANRLVVRLEKAERELLAAYGK